MALPSACAFFPTSRINYSPFQKANQRYRHSFGDKRLSRTAKRTISQLVSRRTCVVSKCSRTRSVSVSIYRFLSNPKVTLSELIHYATDLGDKPLKGRDIYAILDASSVNLSIGPRPHSFRENWPELHGVIDDNRSPGFAVLPSLLVDAQDGRHLGLGDILFHARKLANGTKKEKEQVRAQRRKLAFEERESAMWSIVAVNTAAQLTAAARITFIMDQGADNYASLALIRKTTGRDFIVRSKYNRLASIQGNNEYKQIDQLLAEHEVVDSRLVHIRKLNHFSKSAGKVIQRCARTSKLELKVIDVELGTPYGYDPTSPIFEEPARIIEVREDAATVPPGETPICWKLLTTWELNDIESAWKAVDAYQQRWEVEQLFRIMKKQGFEIEKSQLDHPDKIKKLTTMVLSASQKALALVAARDGTIEQEIQEVFTNLEIKALSVMQQKLNGKTVKSQNPYEQKTMPWAAWIVARAGGWHGYASQRKPGPITMTRGLQEVEIVVTYMDVINGS